MKNKKQLKSILLILGIIFTSIPINNTNFSDNQKTRENNVESYYETLLQNPKTSTTYSEPFIFIDGNWSEATAYDWCYGDGSFSNPYVIENVSIDDGGSSPTNCGILINNSKNYYFTIRNCNISNKVFDSDNTGIRLQNSCNGTIIYNNCSYNDGDGIYLITNCENNTISGNILYRNNRHGIYLRRECKNNTISGNFANHNEYDGIRLYYNSSNNNIEENEFNFNNNDGIRLYYNCSHNNIKGNEFNSSKNDGILLRYNSSFNNILENIVTNTTYNGIDIRANSTDNIVSKNILNDNLRGIYIRYQSHNNKIIENKAYNNNYSIRISYDSNDNIITGNLFKDSINYGIYITDSDCQNNILYQNALIASEGIHASDSGTNNQWDYLGIGNYWDNHTSPDYDNDGIVDNSYIWITGSATIADRIDHYPLAESPIHLGNKIFIDDTGVNAPTWARTAELNFWCTGSGTFSDSYIIEDLVIDAEGSASCIFIFNSRNSYFIIKNCILYNSSVSNEAGIKLENASKAILMNNNCSFNKGGKGISLGLCDNNTISHNIVNENDYGIFLSGLCNNNTISNNIVNNNKICGIELFGSDNNTVSENIITNNTINGIYLYGGCNNNIIARNTLINNPYHGICLWGYSVPSIPPFPPIFYGGLENNIFGNIIENSSYGIYLNYYCSDNILLGNKVSNSSQYAIYLHEESNLNTISGNSVHNNSYGIYIDACRNNLIFCNSIFNNSLNNAMDIMGTNDWNNTIVGNYWGNYTGPDVNLDGIGDDPFGVPGTSDSIDYKPLVDYKPFLLNSPEDIIYELDSENNYINWILINPSPNLLPYKILRDTIQIEMSTFDPSVSYININVDGLSVGNYNYTIIINEGYGGLISDLVWVNVTSPQSPPSNGNGGGGGGSGDDGSNEFDFPLLALISIIIISVIAGAAIAIFLLKKKRSS